MISRIFRKFCSISVKHSVGVNKTELDVTQLCLVKRTFFFFFLKIIKKLNYNNFVIVLASCCNERRHLKKYL